MFRANKCMFEFLTCIIGFSLLMVSSTWGEEPLRYSPNEQKIKTLLKTVKGTPGGYGVRVAKNIVGKWKAMSMMPKTFARNPDMIWHSLEFTKGLIEISYEMTNSGKVGRFVGTYEVIHKATSGRGNAPNIVVRSQDAKEENIGVLVGVNIGAFNCFPPDTPVLLFRDPDGNHYCFEPVGVAKKELFKRMGRISAEELEARRKHAENLKRKKATRITDPKLTKELVADLTEGNLSDHKKNKAILRLMNEGDASCVPLLIELSTNNDNSLVIRQNAIRALGKIGDKKAVPILVNMLEQSVEGNIQNEAESEAIIRRKAVRALGYIGDPSALPVLKKVMKSSKEYQSVREFAEITIRKIEEKK